MAAPPLPGTPPLHDEPAAVQDPPPAVLRLSADPWTSPSYGTFLEMVVQVEDATSIVNVSDYHAETVVLYLPVYLQFSMPVNYSDLDSSRARWQGWLELIDHPTGQGILPATTTDRQRAALRKLALMLINFGTADAQVGQPQRDWARVCTHIQRVASEQGLTGERQLELVLEWVHAEYKVCALHTLLWSLILTKDPRPVAHGEPARVWRSLRMRTLPPRTEAAACLSEAEGGVHTCADQAKDTSADSDSDSSIPSLVTVNGSESE